MIKIIKKGKKNFTTTCLDCGCEFSYELSDLQENIAGKIVKCPCCDKEIIHKESISQVAIPKSNTGNSASSDPTKVWDNMAYQSPETLELREKLAQQITKKYTIPCLSCWWYKQALMEQIRVGDSPCEWCQYNNFKITCTSMGGSDGN